MNRIFFIALLFLSLNVNGQVPPEEPVKLINPRSLSQLIPAQDPQNSTVNKQIKIAEGTMVQLKLLKEVSSASIKEGDTLSFSVDRNLILENHILIKEGAPLIGIISKAKKAKGKGKPGELSFTLKTVTAIDETKISLRTTISNVEGKSQENNTVVLSFINPLFLLLKGKNAVMKEGEKVQAFINNDYIIQIAQ